MNCESLCTVCCQFWSRHGCSINNNPMREKAAQKPRKKLTDEDMNAVLDYIRLENQQGVSYFAAKGVGEDLNYPSQKVSMIFRKLRRCPEYGVVVEKQSYRLWKVSCGNA